MVNPHEIERHLWLFWESAPTPDGPPAQCVVNRFIEGRQARRLLETYWQGPIRATGRGIQERTWQGITYYKPPVRGNFSAYLPDERTLLISAEGPLQHLLSAAGAPGPLADRARQLDLEKHAVIVLAVESFEQQVERLLASLTNGLPPHFREITALVDGVKTASLSVDLTADVTASVVLEAKEPAALPDVADAARTWLAAARSVNPPGGQATPTNAEQRQAPMSMLLTKLFQAAEVLEQAGQVVVRIHRPTDFDDLLARAVQTMVSGTDPKTDWVETGRRLREVGRAMLRYNEHHGHFPVWASRSPDGKPLLSWRVHLLPFLGERPLYERFHLDEPWDSAHNLSLVGQMPAAYRSHDELESGKTSFMVFADDEAPFGEEQGIRMIDIWDGPSNTIMAIEAGPDRAVPWTKPEDLPFDRKDPKPALGQPMRARFLAVYFDGTVHGVTKEADPKVFRRLICHLDGPAFLSDGGFVAPVLDCDEGKLQF
ncbi:MAG: DUF1559 family PulG-like putative transporter [Planctomycetota bacterium]